MDVANWDKNKIKDIGDLLKDRIHVFADAPKAVDYLFNEPVYSDEIINSLKSPASSEILKTVLAGILNVTVWNMDSIHHYLEVLITDMKEKGIKTKQLLQTMRLAITGSPAGPEFAKIIFLLGKEIVIKRLGILLK